MRVIHQYRDGKEELFLEATNEGESDQIGEFAHDKDTIIGTVHFPAGYKLPIIILRKDE